MSESSTMNPPAATQSQELSVHWLQLCEQLALEIDLVEHERDVEALVDLALRECRERLSVPGDLERTECLQTLVNFAREAAVVRERALRFAADEAYAEVFRALGKICHEINNPLTALMGRTQLLRMKAGTDPGALKASEVIEASAQRVADEIRELALLVRRSRDQAESRLEMGD